jgi:hypothetical protein
VIGDFIAARNWTDRGFLGHDKGRHFSPPLVGQSRRRSVFRNHGVPVAAETVVYSQREQIDVLADAIGCLTAYLGERQPIWHNALANSGNSNRKIGRRGSCEIDYGLVVRALKQVSVHHFYLACARAFCDLARDGCGASHIGMEEVEVEIAMKSVPAPPASGSTPP